MEIEPKKNYTLGQMVEAQAFAALGLKTHHAYRTAIIEDMFGKRILKAKIVNSDKGPRGMRYNIKGKNILRYINEKHPQNKQ